MIDQLEASNSKDENPFSSWLWYQYLIGIAFIISLSLVFINKSLSDLWTYGMVGCVLSTCLFAAFS